MRRFYQGGIPLNQAPLCVVEGQVEEPSVAVRPGGGFVVVWADSSTGLIYVGVLSAEGVPQGSSSIQVSPTGESAWDLSVSMDSDGDFVVAWTKRRGLSRDLCETICSRRDCAGLGDYGQLARPNG